MKTSPIAPLPERLRPDDISELVGQAHLLEDGGLLSGMFEGGAFASLILWGPPGSGKTTLARLIAKKSGCVFEPVSAVSSGVAELKTIFARAEVRLKGDLEHPPGTRTLVFVDEVHRFNRAQQDVLLPVIENGTILFIGATTENPSFEVNPALLSRCHVVILKRLDDQAMEQLLARAEAIEGKQLPLTPEARQLLIRMADGDGRMLLNYAEVLLAAKGARPLDEERLMARLQRRAPLYDKRQEAHYNLISALHKSLRGSDADAGLYWLARMLDGGEDPMYIARRLVRFAVEDIGLADPQALMQAVAARDAYHFLGTPEGELALAQCVLYLATAPKSNAGYLAYKSAMKDAKTQGSHMPPAHILNAPTRLMKDIGYGAGYAYDHDAEDAFSGQNYFPDTMQRREYYQPNERGFEREIKKRLEYWEKLRRIKKN